MKAMRMNLNVFKCAAVLFFVVSNVFASEERSYVSSGTKSIESRTDLDAFMKKASELVVNKYFLTNIDSSRDRIYTTEELVGCDSNFNVHTNSLEFDVHARVYVRRVDGMSMLEERRKFLFKIGVSEPLYQELRRELNS